MKIGILTWYFGANYGAKAHSYALQKVLEEMGHSVEMINYIPPTLLKTNLMANFNTPHMRRHPLILLKCLCRCIKFKRWTENMYHITKRVKSGEEVDSLELDAIIIGSDEVFNYRHRIFDEIYYGKGILNKPMITYAPSSGQAPTNIVFGKEIIESMNRIKVFSARDKYTRELIQNNINRDVEIVLDPTLLYDFDFPQDYFKKSDPYLLIYSFDPWDNLREEIREFAREKQLKIISVGRYCKWADISYTTASQYIWFSAFKHADVVFTDSFHGTIFAIKNQKQFIIVSRKDKINKINDLVESLDVNRTFYDGTISIAEYLEDPIDYDKVNKRIAIGKSASIDYLTKALGECSKC